MQLIRYCDDFIVCCKSKVDARKFLKALIDRLKKFNLEVAKDKTKIIKFGRFVWKDWKEGKNRPETFTFLGFTHYCATSRQGKFKVGYKTSRENIRRKLLDIKVWFKKVKDFIPLQEWWPILRIKLLGHYQYFGISGNYCCLDKFYWQVVGMSFKYINERSQRKSMSWDKFHKFLRENPLPIPKIYHNLYKPSPYGKYFVEEPCVGKSQARFCGGNHNNEAFRN